MESQHGLDILYEHACRYRFEAFEKTFSELEQVMPPGELWEAWLMRAQIKLYATDSTAFDDLVRAEGHGAQPQFPCLAAQWKADMPNRFIVFPKAPGALERFLSLLPLIREKLAHWFGRQGHIAVRQMQIEINYFMGEIQTALAYAQELPIGPLDSHTDALLSLIMEYRCHLALGHAAQAEQCMLNIIRLSKAYPECVASYQSFRWWAVLTTSWNGDVPRFYTDESGAKMPVLKDRMEAIQSGLPSASPVGLPFLEYAQHAYPSAYEMSQLYMDVFHAIYWHSADELKQADTLFLKLYQIVKDSGVIMSLVECGEQIVPLLQYASNRIGDCPASWIEHIMGLAKRYEAGLNRYHAVQNE